MMIRKLQSDVIGRCPTNISVEQSLRDMFTVVKTKLPNQCSNRVDHHSSIPSVAYVVPAGIQSVPLLNSTSTCRQEIKAGIMRSVSCKEKHTFRPLSSENGGGAETTVSASLTLAVTEDISTARQTGTNVIITMHTDKSLICSIISR